MNFFLLTIAKSMRMWILTFLLLALAKSISGCNYDAGTYDEYGNCVSGNCLNKREGK